MSPYSREYLEDVHRAALILLYRLLFVFYAEDRALLPVKDTRYDDYSLRWLRDDIATRMEKHDTFSTSATRAWQHLRSLFRAIDKGDDSIGLPPYNGGLFHESAGDLLTRIELPDAELAPLIDGLSRRADISGRGFINYRDLAVQHLGSIYERLLEQRLVETPGGAVSVQPSVFARKNSGSYYTHDDLVKLILRETLDPLARERIAAFDEVLSNVRKRRTQMQPEQIQRQLTENDPADAILGLRVCDPAMGSGHFLVSLVDDLADRVLEQIADASAKAIAADIEHYQSPIATEIVRLRERILTRARAGQWAIDPSLLDDRHLVRRMILKRVVHGVDKNPMAVELAKLALWLHTFTVGAPLSFLDHHLRCGDSLYGERLATVRVDLNRLGGLFNDSHTAGMLLAAQTMREIVGLNDIDLAEVERSRALTEAAFGALDNLRRVFDLWHALRWIAPLNTPRAKRGEIHATASELLSGRYRLTLGQLLAGAGVVTSDNPEVDARVNALLDQCRALATRESFLHWELAFPGIWPNAGNGSEGGFDAVIGNPPWDRMKLQEVEWFAERRPAIALKARAADRKRLIDMLRKDDDPLAADYALAAQRAEDTTRIARDCGEYPLLSSGDINLYSLFVERATHLVKGKGVVGLLTPSGIAADKGAARFFRSISTTGRLGALIDFENRKKLFPDVDSRFKFCALIFGGAQRHFETARCAFYLHSTAELAPPLVPDDADEPTRLKATRVIALAADDFRAVNPNTGTAPIFRNALDAQLTTRIYRTHPVLVKHEFESEPDLVTKELLVNPDKVKAEVRLYPVRYCTMFHMTNDSGLFRRRDELEAEGFYPIAGGRWKKGDAEMLPLYVGRMIQHYDHRAANVVVNEENLHNAALSGGVSDEQKRDPNFLPTPQYWVPATAEQLVDYSGWAIGFRDIARSTDVRTFIGAVVPSVAAGNKLPFLFPGAMHSDYCAVAPLLLANVNSMPFDFVTRQKVQGTSMNWFIVEQLPLISPEIYARPLGTKTVGDFVRGEVLHLTYTAHDLVAFARDLGYNGPPFAWDAEDRLHRMARLDALYFNLYGLSRDEAAYVLDTFPIVRAHDEATFGRFRTKDLVLAYMSALASGDTTSVVAL
ncbi:MAG: restriction endonuclease [Pseudomonadota bacterium]|nr:restriction endonuclease [Pseudomonadota bacterium]